MSITITKQMLDKIHHIDLVDFMSSLYHVNFTSKSSSRVVARCPHPDHEDRKPSFSAWYDNKLNVWCWCCYACHCGKHNNNAKHRNYGQDAIAFVRWMSDYDGSKHVYSFQEAAIIVLRYLGVNIKDNTDKTSSYKKLQINKSVANGCHKYLMSTKGTPYSYLISRGLSDEDLITWRIGFNGERILFPFIDINRNFVGFTMRLIDDSINEAKYINSPNSDIFNKSEYLYGIHLVDSTKNYLVITEGQMDVICAYKYGLINTVATSCAHFTQKQAEYIKKLCPNIERLIFVYDGDNAGKAGMEAGIEIARQNGFMADIYNLPNGTDLCDFMTKFKESGAEIILSSSIPYFYQELENESKEFERIIINYQAKVIPKIKTILNKIVNKNERYLLGSFVNKKFKLDIKEGKFKDEYIDTG